MPVVGVLSSKGGVGASLLATNLAIALSRFSTCLLVDFHDGSGYDDMLLGLSATQSWRDLLPVKGELNHRHLTLTTVEGPMGLTFLAAPDGSPDSLEWEVCRGLVPGLARLSPWLVLDLPHGLNPCLDMDGSPLDWGLVMSTGDPPSLRNAARMVERLRAEDRGGIGLVLNQIARHHPSNPTAVAKSMSIPLLAVLPLDRVGVGMQVNFGDPCVLNRGSTFGRAVWALSRRLHTMMQGTLNQKNDFQRALQDRSGAGE